MRGLFIAVGIVCAVLLFSAPVVAVFKMGASLFDRWMIFAFQIFLTLSGFALSVLISCALVNWSIALTAGQIAELAQKHQEFLRDLKKRTPTFVIVATLVTQLVMVFADKAFGDDSLTIVMVTILLMFFFGLGNEFMVRDSKGPKAFGCFLWAVGILFLPVAVMLHRHIGPVDLWLEFRKIPFRSQLVLLLGTTITIMAPLAIVRRS